MPAPRKHPCPDCSMCQGCSESRCKACRRVSQNRLVRKLSIQEQIELFNSRNSHIFIRKSNEGPIERPGEEDRSAPRAIEGEERARCACDRFSNPGFDKG